MANSAAWGERRVIGRPAIVRGGMAHFRQRSTIDMDALAAELAISRATLYRVAGSRDALLGDVLTALTRRLLDACRAGRRRSGVAGMIEMSRTFGHAMLASEALRGFLAAEPETAARVLFNPLGEVHRTVVAAHVAMLAETGVAAELPPGADPGRLALLYVQLVGAALYADLFAGRPADLDIVEPAVRALLSRTAPRSDPGT